MQKKLYLTAAIYYYYYLLHHILLQLYYKFPLKSNHFLKLFTAKLEMDFRHKVHIPAWVWTFLKFRFMRRQSLTLLLLEDGSDGQVFLHVAVQKEGSGRCEMGTAKAGWALCCVQTLRQRQRDKECNSGPMDVNGKASSDYNRAWISLKLKRQMTDGQSDRHWLIKSFELS